MSSALHVQPFIYIHKNSPQGAGTPIEGKNNKECQNYNRKRKRVQVIIYINCEADSCIYCQDGTCERDVVSIKMKATGEFWRGQRITFPVCQDYEEMEDENELVSL